MTYVQLAFANAVLLLPGAIVARGLAQRGAAPTLAWSLALIFGALAVTFLVGASLSLTLVLFLGDRGRMYREVADWLGSARMPELLGR